MYKKLLTVGLLSTICLVAYAQSIPVNLKTQSGNELGATISAYSYSEPSLSVSMKAINLGIDYTGTYAFGNSWFVQGNANYNNGAVYYSGTGTQSGIPQYYYDFKGVVGYDFAFEGFSLSPYVGIGYRFLSQQWGGTTTSTGAKGYDRQSTYNYLPIGVMHKFAVNEDKAIIETLFEYNYLISGNQYSGLSTLNGISGGNTISGVPNINNAQNSGYGINFTVMYKEESWGVGPYFKYWNIQKSNNAYATVSINGTPVNYFAYEPANSTTEYGVKVIYRF